MVSLRPRSRIGWAQFPTRASASDQASKSPDPSRSVICCSVLAVSGGKSRSSSLPGKVPGNSAGSVLVTFARVRELTGLTTPKGVPRG